MFSSEINSRDMSSSSGFLFSNTNNNNNPFKNVSEEGFLKSRVFMGSDFFPNPNQNQQSCALARYRSAPSSFLAALLDSGTDNSSSVDESEAFFSALVNGPLDLNQKNDNQMQFSVGVMKQEIGVETNGSCSQMGYETAANGVGGAIVGSYSVGMESGIHAKMNNGNGNSSNLVRQSSSPAEFFSGLGVMGEVGNYRVHNHAEANSSASGLSNQNMNISPSPSLSSRFMPSIPENGIESIRTHNPENGRLRNGNSANGDITFPSNSWNESPFNGLKRHRERDQKMFPNFNGLENQNGETSKPASGLNHHLSLPKTSAEVAAVEKYLQFQQDTVPCQIRAKRGCATHPRSIAERMRRIRISEKIKKLQDLFPNMDKQTNTADMLDLAVEYIKDLQKQVQTLTDKKAKCICSSKPKETSPNHLTAS